MTSSHEIFVKWLKEYYSHEFPDINPTLKNEIIEDVVYNNHKYLTREFVANIDGCVQCGRCCESQHCLDYDPVTKKCTRHDNPIHQLCIDYPWGSDEFGISPVTINCAYIVQVFITFFDNYFKLQH